MAATRTISLSSLPADSTHTHNSSSSSNITNNNQRYGIMVITVGDYMDRDFETKTVIKRQSDRNIKTKIHL